jgi:hypothetical protein
MTEHRDRNQERQGPFPPLRGREHPWRATEVEHGPFERRRMGDRRASMAGAAVFDGDGPDEAVSGGERRDDGGERRDDGGERRRQWGRRRSDVLRTEARATLTGRSRMLVRRFREPLIGLTLAGVAAPLINAGMATPESPERESEGEAADPAAITAGERDLEGEVGDYWAEAAETVVRDQTIDGAVVRYGIDRELSEQIYDAATRNDIEPDVAYGLVFVESTFRERAESHVGARGLAQVMPRTAQWLDPTVRTVDLYDPETNLDLGFRYLRQMIDKYDGDVFKALTAYNRGPGTVDRILKRGGNIDNGYAGKVMAG